jgi:hypothetical protein
MHLHEDYHQAKLRSVGVLLSIHAFEEAYELSMRFHCFLGVMNSVWSSSSSTSQRSVARSASHSNLLLLPQLHRQLTDSSSLCGVIDPFPSVTVMQFGRFCLEWLEQHFRSQEILDLGRYTLHHLQEFLKVSHLILSLSVRHLLFPSFLPPSPFLLFSSLLSFCQSRPYLAWIQNLSEGKFLSKLHGTPVSTALER